MSSNNTGIRNRRGAGRDTTTSTSTDTDTTSRLADQQAARKRKANARQPPTRPGVPDDLPPGVRRLDDLPGSERTTTTSNGGDGWGGQTSDSAGGAPGDINKGRRGFEPLPGDRTTPDTNGSAGGASGAGGSTGGVERLDVGDPGADSTQTIADAAGLGTSVTNQVGPQQTEREIEDTVTDQITSQVIRDSATVDIEDDIRVENIRQVDTDDGQRFTGDVRLTDQGRERVRESQLDAIRSRGTTGRFFANRELSRRAGTAGGDVTGDFSGDTFGAEFTAGGAARQQQQAGRAFAGDLRNDFARQQFAEELASQRDGFTASDFDISTRGGVGVELSTGGQSRQGIQNAVEQTEFDRDDFTTTVRDGEIQPRLSDEALRERAAQGDSELDAGDLRVTDRQEFRQFAAAGADIDPQLRRTVELTDEAEARLRLEQAREQNPNAEFELVEGPDGEQRVELQERFDDNGRFLLIPGAEEPLEDAADVTGEFLSGAGTAVGTAAGLQTDLVLSTAGVTDRGDVTDVTAAAGRGGAQLFNIPQTLAKLDEAGEFLGAGAANANFQSGAGTTVGFEFNDEFADDAADATRFFGGQIEQQARENPVEFGAGLAGALATSVGAFRLAGSANTVSGQAVRGLLQPGEEALAAAGFRPVTIAGRAARGAGRRLSGGSISRPELSLGTLDEVRAQAPSVRLGRGSGFVNVDEGVGQSLRNVQTEVTPSITRSETAGDSTLADRIEGARDSFETRAQAATLSTEARIAAAREAVDDFDIRDTIDRPTMERPDIRGRVRAAGQSAALEAESRFFNTRQRLERLRSGPDIERPDIRGRLSSEFEGLTQGGALSGEAAVFNARRGLEGSLTPETSVADLRDQATGLRQGGALSGEAAVFNARRFAAGLRPGRPSLSRPSVDVSRPEFDVSGRVESARETAEGVVQSGALSGEAAAFNARRFLGDLSPSGSVRERLDDVTDRRIEIEPGRPPRQAREIDVSDFDVEASGELESRLFGDGDADADSATVDIDSGSDTGSGQRTILEAEGTGVGRPEADARAGGGIGSATGIRRFETELFSESSVASDAAEPSFDSEQLVDTAAFENSFDSLFTSEVTMPELETGFEPVERTVEGPGETAFEPTDNRFDTEFESGFESGFDTEFETEVDFDIDQTLRPVEPGRPDGARRPGTPEFPFPEDRRDRDGGFGFESDETLFGSGIADFDVDDDLFGDFRL